MRIILNNFTPVTALIGGCSIGIATTLYLATTGRYAGLSGILRSAGFAGDPDRSLDALFLVGLLAGGVAWTLVRGSSGSAITGPPIAAVAAGGILVGFGTALGNGCTSGHGVCGLGRLSFRSLTAVLTFLVTGILTVYLVRHAAGSL